MSSIIPEVEGEQQPLLSQVAEQRAPAPAPEPEDAPETDILTATAERLAPPAPDTTQADEQEAAAALDAALDHDLTVRAIDTARLGYLMESSFGKADRGARVASLMEQTGLGQEEVENSVEVLSAAVEAANFDPAAFRVQRPEFTKFLLQNMPAAETLLQDPAVKKLDDDLRKGDLVEMPEYGKLVEVLGNVGMMAKQALVAAANTALEQTAANVAVSELERGKTTAEDALRRSDEAKARAQEFNAATVKNMQWRTPKMVTREVGDPDKSPTVQAAKNAWHSANARRAGARRLNAAAIMLTTNDFGAFQQAEADELEARLEAISERQAVDNTYIPGAGIGADFASLTVSSLPSLGTNVAGGLATMGARKLAAKLVPGGAALQAFVGAAGVAITRSAAAAVEATEMAGGMFNDLSDALPDAPLEERVALSVAFGAAAAGVSVAPGVFNLKALGPIGDAILAGDGKLLATALTPSLRRAFANAGRAVLKDMAGETGEEIGQDILEKGFKHFYDKKVSGATTPEEWRTIFASADEEAQFFFSEAETAVTVASGMAPGGGLKGAVNIATSYKRAKMQAQDEKLVAGIMEALGSSAIAQAPKAAEKTIEAVTKDAIGRGVNAFYVDAAALQQKAAAVGVSLDELMGAKAGDRVAKALATTGMLEVPLSEWAATWQKSPLAEQLKADISTGALLQTKNQKVAEEKAVEDEAKRIVADAKAGKPVVARTAKEAAFIAKLERQLADAPVNGKPPPPEAVAGAVAQEVARLRTTASRWSLSIDEVLDLAPVNVRSVKEADFVAQQARAKGVSAGVLGLRHAFDVLTGGQTDLTQAPDLHRAMFLDPNTRLYNERAWDLRPAQGKFVIEYDLEGKKFENDVLGHLTLDGDLREMANVLVEDGAVGAKMGSSLFEEAGDNLAAAEELAQAKAAEMSRRLGGLRVTTKVTERQATGKKQADVSAEAQRAYRKQEVDEGRLAHRKGIPVAYARPGDPKINYDWDAHDKSKQDPALGASLESPEYKALKARYKVDRAEHAKTIARVKAAADFKVTPEMVKSLEGKDPVQIANELFLEPSTGLITQAGWDFLAHVLPPADSYVSADMRELKFLNDLVKNGEAVDRVMHLLGRGMAAVAGLGDIVVSHLHGDEYGARLLPGADPKAMAAFTDMLGSLGAAVRAYYPRDGVEGDKPYGLVVVDGVEIAADIGSTFAKADDALNESKAPASQVKKVPALETFATKEERDARIQELQGQRRPNGTSLWTDFSQPLAEIAAPGNLRRKDGPGVGDLGNGVDAAQEAWVPGALEERRLDGWSMAPQGWFVALEDSTNKAADEIALVVEQSDLSTFIHESGHRYLKLLDRLSRRYDTPPAVEKDIDTLLAHLGAKSLGSLTREQQEKFARSSEQYVMEGKAPSVALQPVCKRFKGWLKRIYRKVGKLVDLSDEVRGVFDRIYATDGEIARAREKAGQGTDMLHALGDLVAEGMLTQAEVDRYYKDRAAAEGVAAKAGRLRELKDELRQRNKDIAEAKAEWRAEAEAEYDALPQVRAEAFIRTGVLKGEDGTVLENVPGATLDRAAVESMLGEAAAPLRPYLSKLHAADTVEPGVHPDDLAERAGYNGTGAELLKAILNLVPREEYVRDIVQAHLDYESDLLEARDQVAAEVAKGLHGYETLEWMHTEWRALAGRGKAEVGRIKLAAIERAAEILADEQTLSSVRPHHALQAERTAADAAMAAAAAGNYGLAMVHQERRMLNAALYRKLLEAKQLKDTLDERAKRLSTDSARAKLGKADLAFRDAADEILETLGYSKPREREVPLRGQAALLAAFEKFGFTVLYDTAVVDRLLAARKSWRMLTVAEAREVDRALRQISKTAGNVAGVQLKGQRISLQDALARLAQAAKENHPKDRAEPASSKGAASLRQKAADTLSGIDGELLQMATLVDMLGGYEVDSVWRELLFNPLQKAKQREYDLVNSTVKPIVELLRKMPPGVKRRLREKVDGKKLFPQHTDDATAPTRRFELLTIALNAGNESNLERLLQGRNISPDQLQAAIDLLTEEEMAWVQSVWDANEKLWPLSADLEERQSGLRPKAIVATPVIWRGQKTFRGGYYPAIYDRRFGGNNTGEKQALDGVFDMGFTRPGTNRSHLKKRAEHFNDVVDLDFRHLSAHVVQVAHDVAFREALGQAARIVLHKDFQALVKRKVGDKKAALFLQWLKDIGHARAAQPDTGARTLTNGLRVLRSNFAVSTLGYAADIAAGDLTNTLVAAADKVGVGHLAKAGMRTGMSPVQMRAFALQKSGELRFRQEGLARELRNQLDRMTAKNAVSAGPLAWWKEHAFALQETIDAATATPVWIGAYNQGLADAAGRKGFVGEEAEQYAVDFADDIVRRSFPSHSPVDQSATMRDRGFAGTMLLFHGYFNLIYQRDREDVFRIVRAWEDGATAESLIAGMKAAGKVTARASGRMLGRALAVFVLGNFLSGRGPAAGEPPEEWLARSLLLERLMLLPFGDVAVASIESVAKGKRANVRAAPGLAALYEVGDTLLELGREKSSTSKKVAAAAKLAAMFAGIPGTRPIRGAQFVFDLVADPKTSAKDPFDAGSQLVYGPDGKYKKADPLGVISSALP